MKYRLPCGELVSLVIGNIKIFFENIRPVVTKNYWKTHRTSVLSCHVISNDALCNASLSLSARYIYVFGIENFKSITEHCVEVCNALTRTVSRLRSPLISLPGAFADLHDRTSKFPRNREICSPGQVRAKTPLFCAS